jgi:hypothetical protein
MTDTGPVLQDLEQRYHAFAGRHQRLMPWESANDRRQAHEGLQAAVAESRRQLARTAPRAQSEDQQATDRKLLVLTALAEASLNEPPSRG